MTDNTPTHPAIADADELHRLLAQVGTVGDIDGHPVIRRSSVLELVKRRTTTAPAAADAETRFEQFVQAAIAQAPAPLLELGRYLADVLDADQFPKADRLLLQLATAPALDPLAPLARAVVFAATPADELAACRALARFLAADFDAAMATPAPAAIAAPAVLRAAQIDLAGAAATGAVDGRDLGADPPDPIYAGAVAEVRASGVASISRIQRVFRIGYNRAARLIEAMEADGIVSAMDASGHRRVIATDGAPA